MQYISGSNDLLNGAEKRPFCILISCWVFMNDAHTVSDGLGREVSCVSG